MATVHHNVTHLIRRYKVRVSIPGVASYSYLARARSSHELWMAAFERAVVNCKENDLPPTISVVRTDLKGVRS